MIVVPSGLFRNGFHSVLVSTSAELLLYTRASVGNRGRGRPSCSWKKKKKKRGEQTTDSGGPIGLFCPFNRPLDHLAAGVGTGLTSKERDCTSSGRVAPSRYEPNYQPLYLAGAPAEPKAYRGALPADFPSWCLSSAPATFFSRPRTCSPIGIR